MEVKVIRDVKTFDNLRDQINALVIEGNYDITLTWEWLSTWWAVFEDNRSLYVLALFDNKDLIGIAPFYILNKTISFLASGEDERDEICSDYHSFIIKNGFEDIFFEHIFCFLIKNKSEWNIINLSDFFQTTPVYPAFLRAAATFKDISIETGDTHVCPYIQLPGSWDDYVKQTKVENRIQINRKIRNLSKHGVLRYDIVNNPSELYAALNRLAILHEYKWAEKGEQGCFTRSKRFVLFHEKLIEQIKQFGAIRFYFLSVNNVDVAGMYGFIHNKTYYYYQTGNNTSIIPKSSPQTVLIAFSIQDCISNGIFRFDFFKGNKGSYKYDWASNKKILTDILVMKRCTFHFWRFIIYGKLKSTFKYCAHLLLRKTTVKNVS